MEPISLFLPVRSGSERIIEKNTRAFGEFKGGLLELKLIQLLSTKCINEIVVSTNDSKCIDIAEKFKVYDQRLIIDKRPDFLCNSTTGLNELIEYVPKICSYEHILWTHVTSPFIFNEDYDNAVQTYFDNLKYGNDSLMSVKKYNSFLWDKSVKEIVNRKDSTKWPRTQDLAELYEIDSGIFLASKSIYLSMENRIGTNPYLLTLKEPKSFDIDWEMDFQIGEIIFKEYYSKQLRNCSLIRAMR